MDSSRRVLVIGAASDTETVLRAVLEPRGTTVEHSRFPRPHQIDLSIDSQPEVVVIDLDSQAANGDRATSLTQSSRVLIGSSQPQTIGTEERFLSKPFHFPELVQLIEELLEVGKAA